MLFLVIPWLIVAVWPCMEWIPIKINIVTSDHYSQLKSVKKGEVRRISYWIKKELKKLRVLIGQINLFATQTCPCIPFDCHDLASILKNATVEDILKDCVHHIFASLILSLKESSCKTKKNVVYFTWKSLFIIKKISLEF